MDASTTDTVTVLAGFALVGLPILLIVAIIAAAFSLADWYDAHE